MYAYATHCSLVKTMAGKQAKILSDSNVGDLLAFADTTRHPLRIVLLSAKAGLRAAEIAHLTWSMVTDPNGAVSTCLQLPDGAAKKGSGRTVPLHSDLKSALCELRQLSRADGPIIVSERGGHRAILLGKFSTSMAGGLLPRRLNAMNAYRTLATWDERGSQRHRGQIAQPTNWVAADMKRKKCLAERSSI
jgi:integrase